MRDLSSCIVEKFNSFNVIYVKFSKSIRQTFRPVDIIYKPVRKPDKIINCYFSERLNLAFHASFSEGPKVLLENINLIAISKFAQVNQAMFTILIHNIY